MFRVSSKMMRDLESCCRGDPRRSERSETPSLRNRYGRSLQRNSCIHLADPLTPLPARVASCAEVWACLLAALAARGTVVTLQAGLQGERPLSLLPQGLRALEVRDDKDARAVDKWSAFLFAIHSAVVVQREGGKKTL